MRNCSWETHYSITSSRTMFTYTSKPLRVPTISFSPFMITQILDPTHLSTNSDGRSWDGLVAMALVGNAILLNARRHKTARK